MMNLSATCKKPLRLALALSLTVFTVSGCTAALMDTMKYGIFTTEEVNLTERNYAVADYLIQQGGDFVSKQHLIRAMPLHDKLVPDASSDFARIMPEQMGMRLAQLGYRVDLQPVMNQAKGTNYLQPQMKAGEEPDFVLSGSYLREKQNLHVSTNITNVRTGRIVAVFDHTLPLNKYINQLAAPKAQIFKVPETSN